MACHLSCVLALGMSTTYLVSAMPAPGEQSVYVKLQTLTERIDSLTKRIDSNSDSLTAERGGVIDFEKEKAAYEAATPGSNGKMLQKAGNANPTPYQCAKSIEPATSTTGVAGRFQGSVQVPGQPFVNHPKCITASIGSSVSTCQRVGGGNYITERGPASTGQCNLKMLGKNAILHSYWAPTGPIRDEAIELEGQGIFPKVMAVCSDECKSTCNDWIAQYGKASICDNWENTKKICRDADFVYQLRYENKVAPCA